MLYPGCLLYTHRHTDIYIYITVLKYIEYGIEPPKYIPSLQIHILGTLL